MIRAFAGVVTLCLFLSFSTVEARQTKNQMVKGTVKSIDTAKGVLVIDQKLKDQTVERQLDITNAVTWVITIGNEKKEVTGKDGLFILDGKKDVTVAVKCDKDVNVLSITANVKK